MSTTADPRPPFREGSQGPDGWKRSDMVLRRYFGARTFLKACALVEAGGVKRALVSADWLVGAVVEDRHGRVYRVVLRPPEVLRCRCESAPACVHLAAAALALRGLGG